MKEKLAYEEYPISEEEMGKHYKAWMNVLAQHVVYLFKLGKEMGGEKFIDRVKADYSRQGELSAAYWMKKSGTKSEDFNDCSNIPKIQDMIDTLYANFWDGYIENTPQAFEKEVTTCPVAKPWCQEPDICDAILGSFESGLMKGLNPKFRPKGFSRLLVKGDSSCRFRVELED
ncbi:MAG: hypothetical protein KKH99_04785 [Proteobacteria bacterium]|nr:hypothetical protein [Pseudomonadota bacterium]